MPPRAPAIGRWTCRRSAAIFSRFPGTNSAARPAAASLYGRRELLQEMPPFHGGGDMISSVDFFHSTWKEVPHKFEAGTPDFAAAIGLRAALDYISSHRLREHRPARRGTWPRWRWRNCRGWPGMRLFGPQKGHAGVVSFLLRNIHAHDVVTVADQRGVALRGGPPLQPAADETAGGGIDRARQFLFLQHGGGSGPAGGGHGGDSKIFWRMNESH